MGEMGLLPLISPWSLLQRPTFPQCGLSGVLPDVSGVLSLLAGRPGAGMRECPSACGKGWGREPKALFSVLETSVCLQLVVWWEKQQPTGYGVAVVPLSQLSLQPCPSRLQGLLLYLLSCARAKSWATTRGM